MSITQSDPRPARFAPLRAWQRLPFSAKLIAPVVLAFVIIVVIFVVLVPPLFNQFIADTTRLGFETQLDRLDGRVRDLFISSRRTIDDLAGSTQATTLATAYASGDRGQIVGTRAVFIALLRNTVRRSDIPFANLRFVSLGGAPLVRIDASGTETGSNEESEASAPYFEALQGLERGQVYYSSPMLVTGQAEGRAELAIEVGAPVYAGGRQAGYLVGSLRPHDYLMTAFEPSPLEIFRFQTVLLDQDGNPFVVASSLNQPPVSVLGSPTFAAPALPEAAISGGEQTLLDVGDRTYSTLLYDILSRQGYQHTGWRLVVSKAIADEAITRINEVINLSITRSLLVLIGALILIGLGTQAAVRPLARVSAGARQIAAGDLQTRIRVRPGDEIGDLAEALNSMSARLYDVVSTLERRVAERTRNIQIVAEISRNATQMRDIGTLLQRAVDSIRDQFNFYHAQVFLVDDAGKYAVLVTSTGEAGKELLARRHKLAVGSPSIVGQVTEKRRTFITLDTQQSEVPHRFNPILPLTRSEMALPLQVGDKLIGALDIQSVEPDAFDDDDVQIFQVLADQLAIAVDNARLLMDQQQRVEQIDALNRMLTRSTWETYLEGQGARALAFQYDLRQVLPADDSHPVPADGASQIDAPIRVRGETVGSLSVAGGTEVALTGDEQAVVQAVAERVALAIENLRLVEQTQSALGRVEQLYETTRALGSTGDIADVYQVTADRFARFGFIDRLVVLLARPVPAADSPYFEYAYVWDRRPEGARRLDPTNRIAREVLPARWFSAESRDPRLADLDGDLEGLPDAQQMIASINVRSLLVAPLTTPARWFGAMLLYSEQPDAFTGTFTQFVGAVADQVAIALENRYLFDQAGAEARRSRALAEAAQIVSQIGLDFETGIANLIETVARAAGFDRWWFGQVLLRGRGVTVERVTAQFEDGSPLELLEKVTLEVDHNAIAEATRTGTSIVVNAPEASPVTAHLPADVQEAFGKHVAVPVRTGANTVGALLMGRSIDEADVDQSDVQLAATVANQIAVALENRRLFNVAQSEREVLQTVLNSLPTGVMVTDAATEQPLLTNDQARRLLGTDNLVPYYLTHTGTDTPYDEDELPMYRVLQTQEPIYAEDMTVITPDGRRTDLLVNAVPIFRDGRPHSAVTVFQDVTELRQLESVLQESLRETTTLYEVSRAVSAEHELTNILKAVGDELNELLAPDHLFFIFNDGQDRPAQTYALYTVEGEMVPVLMEEASLVPRSVLLSDEAFADSDILHNPNLADDPRLRALGIVSLSTHPLQARSRTIGWLLLGFSRARALLPEERRTLGNIADQTAVAVESARLAEQTTQALATTTRLYETSLNISRADSIEATLSVIRDQLKRFSPSQIDIFLISHRGDQRTAEWVVRWDAHDPTADGEVVLAGAPLFENWRFIESDPLYVDDVAATDRHTLALLRTLPGWGNFTAQASVPLAVKGRVMGRLVVSFVAPHRFTEAEQQIMGALADQGAIAIDNFLLVQQTQETLDETAVLYQASRAISNAADMHEQLMAVIDYAVQPQVTGALLIRLLSETWDAPDATIEIVANWHRERTDLVLAGSRFTPGQFPAWREISSSSMVWIDDLTTITQPSLTDATIYRSLGFRSVLVFPLTSAGKPIGALLFGSAEAWPYTEREMRVYTSLADLIAISMERQRLLEQTERRARQLQLSAQIAQAAASILNLNELFERTVYLIRDSFGYDHVQVFRISPDGRDARVVAATGEAGQQLLSIGHHLPVGSRSVIGQVTATGQPYIIADTASQGTVHQPNPYLPNTRAEMGLPLIARNRILGVLDVQSNVPGAFTADDVAVLSTLADQIAIAIDNAGLFEISARRAEEMQFLFDVTRTAAGIAEEAEPAIRRVAQLVLENLGASATALLLMDETQTRLLPYWATAPELTVEPPPYFEFSDPFLKNFAAASAPLIINDVEATLKAAQTTSKLGQSRLLTQLRTVLPQAGSMLLAPLLSGENFLGMLGVARTTTDGFSEDSVRLVQTLTSSLSALLQNARLLREVQNANVRLMELDRVKNQFLANMSHELRTPLNSIIGFSRVILKGIDGPLTDMQEQDLTTIYESGRHLLGLVNDILDQAKIEADRMEFQTEHFSMVELIRGVMSTAVGLVKDKPIRLHQEIEENLPPAWGDEFRTRQALLNLVSNAAKFTHEGAITASAFQVEYEGRSMIQVSITDTGIGIPADKLETIFEPFQQAENSPARQYEGTGLGLPIARKLIERQGGKMWVTSDVGVGSTFSFVMPINPVPLPDDGEPAEQDIPMESGEPAPDMGEAQAEAMD